MAWGFTIPSIILTALMLLGMSASASNIGTLLAFLFIFALIVFLTLGLSICGMIFSISAARRSYPKNCFLPQLILSAICLAFNGIMLFVSMPWI